MAGSFELKKAANGKFHFNVKAGNGEIILTSQMYASQDSAEAGIASIQKNCGNDDRYNKEESSNGKFYFTLKAGNHQVIGKSQMYKSAESRDNGIDSLKRNGVSTTIKNST